jgi:hypothetical protein
LELIFASGHGGFLGDEYGQLRIPMVSPPTLRDVLELRV